MHLHIFLAWQTIHSPSTCTFYFPNLSLGIFKENDCTRLETKTFRLVGDLLYIPRVKGPRSTIRTRRTRSRQKYSCVQLSIQVYKTCSMNARCSILFCSIWIVSRSVKKTSKKEGEEIRMDEEKNNYVSIPYYIVSNSYVL